MPIPHQTDASLSQVIPDLLLKTENRNIWTRGSLGTLERTMPVFEAVFLLYWEVQSFSKTAVTACMISQKHKNKVFFRFLMAICFL